MFGLNRTVFARSLSFRLFVKLRSSVLKSSVAIAVNSTAALGTG